MFGIDAIVLLTDNRRGVQAEVSGPLLRWRHPLLPEGRVPW